MLKSTIYSLGNPGTFDISDKDDPQYYIARYAHEMSKNLYDLNQAGFEWRQHEQTDFASLETEFDTWFTAIATWFEDAVEDSMAGDPIAALPSVPDFFPSYEAATGEVSIWWIIIKLVIYFVLIKIRKGLESGTDTAEVVNILRRIFLRKNEAEEEFSLIELLANIPTEVILSKGANFQDIILASQPSS